MQNKTSPATASFYFSAISVLSVFYAKYAAYDKTILQLASAALVLVPYLAVTDGVTGIAWTPQVIILLLFVGIVHTGLSYALYFGSMEGVRTQTLALFSYIDPVTALILSALLLHEKMTMLGILGACMILGAAIVSERK